MHFFAREMSFFINTCILKNIYIFKNACILKIYFFDFEIYIKSSRAPIYNSIIPAIGL